MADDDDILNSERYQGHHLFPRRLGKTKTGVTKLPEYCIWADLRRRCRNPKQIYYYGRVVVATEWKDFEQFYADMGSRPSPLHSIERIDNDGPYAPDNCRWATRKEQGRNKRNNVKITYQERTLTLSEWSQELNISEDCLQYRVKKWGCVPRVLLAPVQKHRGKRSDEDIARQREGRIAVELAKGRRIQVICQTCGIEFGVGKHRAHNVRFCSMDCRRRYYLTWRT